MKPNILHVLEPFAGYWAGNGYWDAVDWLSRSAQIRDPGRMTSMWPDDFVRRNHTEFWRARQYYNDRMIVLQWVDAIGDWRTMPGSNIYMTGDDDED